MRRYLAYAFAAAFAAMGAPAVAQDAPPAPGAAPVTQGWVDPQAPLYPSPLPVPQVDAGGSGAPFARPLPPEALAPYAYRYAGNPCGCPGYVYPPVSWVPVPIQTRYVYSAPIRHESEVVEEKIVEEQVGPPVRVRPKRAAPSRSPRRAKSKLVRTTR
jgi:hypothetical protein